MERKLLEGLLKREKQVQLAVFSGNMPHSGGPCPFSPGNMLVACERSYPNKPGVLLATSISFSPAWAPSKPIPTFTAPGRPGGRMAQGWGRSRAVLAGGVLHQDGAGGAGNGER